jgi:hypothetical protein|nr:MAG TPA: hypothetical protein [Caudoviricetes sp.]
MKASEMMAARKAAKKEQAVKKYARDNIGNQRADRNKLANIAVIQVQNKLSLRSGAPQDLDSKLTENIKNLMHYQALVYDNDRSSITVFEKLIRAMRVVSCIYSDSDLSKTTNDAQAAIEQLQESDDLSPNQRREILKPVLRLTEYQEAYGEIIPERTVTKIGLYCASVQIALYTASLYTRPKRYIQALFDIINGESLRAIAKKIDEKENVLREEVLNDAWHFFRVAECNSAIQPVSSIPELRQDGYKVLADFERLKDFIQTAMQKILIPFEQNTGISLINYNQFRKDLVQAEII